MCTRFGSIVLRAAILPAFLMAACNSAAPIDRSVERPTETVALDSTLEAQRTPDADLAKAFADHAAALQVLVRGTVVKHLADDVEGDRHQRFILKLESGQTLLVAHNIDLATRVPASSLGKVVYAYGQYEWNDEGGVVHWTHKDPGGTHVDGWLQFEGTRYE